MELRETLGKRIEKSVFYLSLILLLVSILASLCLYFNNTLKSLKKSISFLEETEMRIQRVKTFLLTAEKYTFTEKNSLAFARLLDTITSKLKEPQIVISSQKTTEKEKAFTLSVKGEARFSEVLELFKILEEQRYPIVFLKSYSLRKKDASLISYEVVSEIFLVAENESVKGR